MSFYKILASDLDGTLLNTKGEISRENLEAITALHDSGVAFVPATGRAYSEIPDPLKAHPHIRYIIYSSGVAVYDKESGRRLFSFGMGRAVTEPLFSLLERYDTHVTVREGGVSYIDAGQTSDAAFEHYHMFIPHRRVLRRYGQPKDNLMGWAHTLDDIEMICVFFSRDDEYEACKAQLFSMEGITCAEIAPYSIEIVSRNAGKGEALAMLAQLTDTPISQTAAVGDSTNDISMIKAAGLGIAVSNADPAVKAVCDREICSCDEHAIAYIARMWQDGEK